MSVPMWERGALLGDVLTLLLAVAAHAVRSHETGLVRQN